MNNNNIAIDFLNKEIIRITNEINEDTKFLRKYKYKLNKSQDDESLIEDYLFFIKESREIVKSIKKSINILKQIIK